MRLNVAGKKTSQEEHRMVRQQSRLTPKRRPARAAFRLDADENRAALGLGADDENAFVEDLDPEEEYQRGVEDVSRRWSQDAR